MNIVLPDGFVIHHSILVDGISLWTARWSDGANIPLGLPLERGTHGALLPDFFPAGLLLFGSSGRFTNVHEGGPEHDRLQIHAYGKDHAKYAFRMRYGLNVPPLAVPVVCKISVSQKPPDELRAP